MHSVRKVEYPETVADIWIGCCVAALLFFTFRLYGFAHFWLDDFNNLHWVRPKSLPQMLWYVVNPASDFFRPVGMFLYWMALRLFDQNAAAYHWFLWSLHTINVGLLYCILRRFTNSSFGAAVGAMLFASQHVFNDVYWSFGTIFEVVGAMIYFVGILLWSKEHRSFSLVALASVVLLLGLKAKEMVITLPAIWLMQDLLIRRTFQWKLAVQLIVPSIVGFWYGLRKLAEMGGTYRTHPYFMEMSALTLGRGFGGYFNMLFRTAWRWQFWAIGFVAMLLFLILLRNRPAMFFQLYIFISFLPMIFLINHRDPFYWYFPMLGICGLVALVVGGIATFLSSSIPDRIVMPITCAVFAVLCYQTYIHTRDWTEPRRLW